MSLSGQQLNLLLFAQIQCFSWTMGSFVEVDVYLLIVFTQFPVLGAAPKYFAPTEIFSGFELQDFSSVALTSQFELKY